MLEVREQLFGLRVELQVEVLQRNEFFLFASEAQAVRRQRRTSAASTAAPINPTIFGRAGGFGLETIPVEFPVNVHQWRWSEAVFFGRRRSADRL